MGILDDAAATAKTMRATGIYNRDNPVDNDILAFDLSSQNYDAAGAEGWGNRMKSLWIPGALVDTWNGVVKNNAIKNPDSDFFTSVRDNLLGYAGGLLKGAFATTGILEPIAKGAVLSIGSIIDEVNDNVSGNYDTDTLLDKIRKSWDLSYTTEYFSDADPNNLSEHKQSIGLGEALLWLGGRTVNALTGDEQSKKDMMNAGIGFASDDFDIFSKADSDTMTSGWGQIAQPFNLAGEMVFDITNFVGAGAVAKTVNAVSKGWNIARFGIAGSKWEAKELINISKGLAGTYDNTIDELLGLDIIGKKNWLASKGVTKDGELGLYSTLLDSAKTKSEVADVILAVDHRSLEHINKVAKRLSDNKDWLGMGAVDSLSSGGTLKRTINEALETMDESSIPFKTDDEMAQSFSSFISDILNDVSVSNKNNDQLKSLRDLVTEETSNGVTWKALNTKREMSVGTSQFGMAKIKWASKDLNDNGIWKTVEYTSKIPGVPRVIKFVRNAGKIYSNGRIDYAIEKEVGLNKLLQTLGNINDYTKGTFGKSGKLEGYTRRAMAASNDPAELARITDDVMAEQFLEIANKRKVFKEGKADTEEVFKIAQQLHKGMWASKDQEDAILKMGKPVYYPEKDAVLISEGFDEAVQTVETGSKAALRTAKQIEESGTTARYIMDINELDKLVGRTGSNFGESLFWIGRNSKNAVANFNYWFSNLILIRPARLGRERLANLPGYAWIILSGNYNDLLSANAKQGFYNMIQNIPSRMRNNADSLKLKMDNNLRNTHNVKMQLNGVHRNVTTVLDEYDKLIGNQSDELYSDAAKYADLTTEQLDYIARAEIELGSKEVYIAGANIPKMFNGDNLVASSDSATEALSWKQNFEDNNILNNAGIKDASEIADIAEASDYKIVVESNGIYINVSPEDFRKNGQRYIDSEDTSVAVIGKDWKKPQSNSNKVYGEHYDISDPTVEVPQKVQDALNEAGFKTVDEYRDWVASGQHNLNACGRGTNLVEVLTQAGIGSLSVAEGVAKSTFVNPNMIETATNNPVENLIPSYIPKVQQKIIDKTFEFDLKHKKQVTELDVIAQKDLARIRQAAGGNENVKLEVIKEFKSKQAYYKSLQAQIQSRLNKIDEITNASRTAKGLKETISKGQFVYRGQRVNNFAEGQEGIIAAGRLSSGNTYDEIFTAQKIDRNVYGARDNVKIPELESTDPNYFDGLAGWLQVYGRGDTVFEMLASGKSKDEILSWLNNTAEGKLYAESRKIGRKYNNVNSIHKAVDEGNIGYHQDLESFIDERANLAGVQIFNDEVRKVFFSGEPITGDFLRKVLSNQTEPLPTIIGEVFDPQSYKSLTTAISNQFRKINRVLVEQPQDILENFPVATAIYQRNVQDMIDEALTAKGTDSLSVAEVNAIERSARDTAIKETRKWFYNVQSQSNLSAALSTFIPFITAYTFTVKQFARGIKENPVGTMWMLSGIQKTIGEMNWIDAEGNDTDMMNAANLSIPLSKEITDILKGTMVGQWLTDNNNELRISARSLNVWFGGEIVPGPGPLVTIPASELVKGNTVFAMKLNQITKGILPFLPSDEGIVDYLLPMGPSEKPLSFDMVLPTWINNAADAGAFTQLIDPEYRGKQYLDTYAKVASYLSVQHRLKGPNEPLPTPQEIEDKVNALYGLKFISAFTSPAGFNIKTEVDLAREVYKQYKNIYGESADWYFQEDHPELINGMSSIYGGDYGLSPDQQTVKNIDANPTVTNIFANAAEDSKDMMGFFMNTSSDPQFDEYAWTYLNNRSAAPGEPSYYSSLSGPETSRRAAERLGWTYYNKAMSALDATALELGVDANTDSKLKEQKSQILEQLGKDYPEWYTSYKQTNTNKWNDRIITISSLLNDDNFLKMTDPTLVDSLYKFISMRQQVVEILDSREVKSLTAKKNKDVYKLYTDYIYNLKNQSIRFSDFYNRYFENDTLR